MLHPSVARKILNRFVPTSDKRREEEPQLVPAERIGVSLTLSGLMVPEKSVSTVIGMGPQMPSWTQAEYCDRCSLTANCHYRIHA